MSDGIGSCSDARTILKEHIERVVGHFRGRIAQWDVVNEILDEQGRPRTENPFVAACGLEPIVADAFRWAHAADPAAKLYLNDFDQLGGGSKAEAQYALVKQLLADEVPIDSVGFQSHLTVAEGVPTDAATQLRRYADLGLDVAITEADVRMPRALTASALDTQVKRQADIYSRLAQLCVEQQRCINFTVWGFTDRWSWVSGTLPSQGNACLMDADLVERPAWNAVRSALLAGRNE